MASRVPLVRNLAKELSFFPRNATALKQTRSVSTEIKNRQPTKKSTNGLTSQYALVDHSFDAVVVGAGECLLFV